MKGYQNIEHRFHAGNMCQACAVVFRNQLSFVFGFEFSATGRMTMFGVLAPAGYSGWNDCRE